MRYKNKKHSSVKAHLDRLLLDDNPAHTARYKTIKRLFDEEDTIRADNIMIAESALQKLQNYDTYVTMIETNAEFAIGGVPADELEWQGRGDEIEKVLLEFQSLRDKVLRREPNYVSKKSGEMAVEEGIEMADPKSSQEELQEHKTAELSHGRMEGSS